MPKLHAFLLGILAILPLTTNAQKTEHSAEDWVWLENNHIRLGVLKSSGGGIGHFGPVAEPKVNFLNHYDRGRLIQQSYYGDTDGSLWVKNPWRYNPVQGGDYLGKASLLNKLTVSPNKLELHTDTTPLHWATGKELKECRMEQWITLEPNSPIAKLRFRFTYTGTTTHKAHHQEMPAVFVQADHSTLVVPRADGTLQRISPTEKNQYVKLSPQYPWVAYIDAKDHAIAMQIPTAEQATYYRFAGGHGSSCSYVAPLRTLALTPGFVIDYQAKLMYCPLAEVVKAFPPIPPPPVPEPKP